MGNGFLSRVNWNGTLVFMLIRVAFASVGFLLLMAFTGAFSQAQGGDVAGSILMIPIVCQSALKFDPLSASNIDPLGGEQARRCVALT